MSQKQSKKLNKVARLIAKDKKIPVKSVVKILKKMQKFHPMNFDKALGNV
jgi:restriction endonuclease